MTKNSAQIRSGTVRKKAISPRARTRTTGCGESPSAARIASGKLRIRPSTQPDTAIWKVVASDQKICSLRLRSGGNIRVRMLPI